MRKTSRWSICIASIAVIYAFLLAAAPPKQYVSSDMKRLRTKLELAQAENIKLRNAVAESKKKNLKQKRKLLEEREELKQQLLELKEEKAQLARDIKLREGSAFAVWSDLSYIYKGTEIDKSKFAFFPEPNVPIANHGREIYMQNFLDAQRFGDVESKNASRPNIRFLVDIFGRLVPGITNIHSNHICPHSYGGRTFWEPFVRYMGGKDQNGVCMTAQETRMVVHGAKKATCNHPGSKANTRPYSSLTRARPNLFAMRNGLMYYDRDPSVGILPIRSMKHSGRWVQKGYYAIVLAESAEQYTEIGATMSPILHTLNSSVPQDRRKIRLALRSMVTSALRSAALFLSDSAPKYVPSQTTLGEEALDEESEPVQRYEKYIWEIHESIKQSKSLYVPDPDNIPHDKLFRLVRFGPAEFANEMPDSQPEKRPMLHPAPIPELLQQRNLNVIVNHWYKTGNLNLAPLKPGVSAAFWPSCLDLDSSGNSCNLCRYRMSCDGGYGVELFARDENEAVFWTSSPAARDELDENDARDENKAASFS